MIDQDDDIQALLDAAMRGTSAAGDQTEHAQPPSEPIEVADDGDMTSVMGPEERRLLQQAARRDPPRILATRQATGPQDDHARPTARPPSSGNEPPVSLVSDAPVGDTFGTSELVATIHEQASERASMPGEYRSTHRRQPLSRAWPIVAFVLLAAAAWFATRQ